MVKLRSKVSTGEASVSCNVICRFLFGLGLLVRLRGASS